MNTILNQPTCRHVSTDRLNVDDSQLVASFEGESSPTPAGKTLPQSYPKPDSKGEGATSTCSLGGRQSFAHFFSTSCSSSEVLRTNTTNTWCSKRGGDRKGKKNETNFGFVLPNVIHSIFHLFSEGTASTSHPALSVVCIAHAHCIKSGCGRREAYKIWSMRFPE